MLETTLCYLERGDEVLLLHRTKKPSDVNAGKWIGVGGKLEPGETPEACMRREILEETGLSAMRYAYRGIVDFLSDVAPPERMHLFTVTAWEGEQHACDEGVLQWVPKATMESLPMWEGDRVFLRLLRENAPFFRLRLFYEGETLVKTELDEQRGNPMNLLDQLAFKMMEYDAGDAGRIQHFLKVHSLARLIGVGEKLPAHTLFLLEAAALTHDIGIKPALALHGRCDGPLQEELGPPVAQDMLTGLGFASEDTARVCFLIAHHHTYDAIDGMDYQILVEADFLVNLHEGGASRETVRTTCERIFRTKTGKELCRSMFGV